MAAAVVGLLVPEFRPIAAIVALTAVALDVFGVDRRQKRFLKVAALIAERFDCAVLELPWNTVAIRSTVPEALVQERSAAYTARVGHDSRIRDWYPVVAANAPMHLGRIVCQLTNAQYDGRLRDYYKWTTGLLALVGAMALAIAGLVVGLSLSDFLLTAVAPALPLLVWAGRELVRQRDTDDPLRDIQAAAFELWDDAIAGRATPDQCADRSRTLQDSIFHYRTRSPLPIPFIYSALRPRLETKMNVSAEDRLRQAGLL